MENIEIRSKKTAAPHRHRATMIGVVLKCSVCVLLLSLVWEIGMRASDMPSDMILAGSSGVPYSFYVK